MDQSQMNNSPLDIKLSQSPKLIEYNNLTSNYLNDNKPVQKYSSNPKFMHRIPSTGLEQKNSSNQNSNMKLLSKDSTLSQNSLKIKVSDNKLSGSTTNVIDFMPSAIVKKVRLEKTRQDYEKEQIVGFSCHDTKQNDRKVRQKSPVMIPTVYGSYDKHMSDLQQQKNLELI